MIGKLKDDPSGDEGRDDDADDKFGTLDARPRRLKSKMMTLI
jgi:hypothetical protein